MSMILDRQRRKFRDTPCARCGHGHAGSDGHYAADGNTRSYYERCGEWLSWFRSDLQAMHMGPCWCPEWVAAPFRCVCGETSLRQFPRWLNGREACSVACAIRLVA